MTKTSHDTNTVTLEFYNEKYQPSLNNFYLPEEQQMYTALPTEAIVKCQEDPDRFPIIILNDQDVAGFFVLHGWEGVKAYWENKDAILVRAYSIDTLYQGKGIAKDSLKQLPSFVKKHFSDKNEIILAVNQTNIIAQNVYKKGGFIDKGMRAMGRKGELLVFHMDL